MRALLFVDIRIPSVQPKEFFFGVAQEFAAATVNQNEPTFRVTQEDAIGCLFDQGAVLALVVGQVMPQVLAFLTRLVRLIR
jgi:hypothetical protein